MKRGHLDTIPGARAVPGSQQRTTVTELSDKFQARFACDRAASRGRLAPRSGWLFSNMGEGHGIPQLEFQSSCVI
jgi:hypothetical protein